MPLIAESGLYAQSYTLKEAVEKVILQEGFVDYALVPGLVIGITDHGQAEYLILGHGVDTSSIFELGSLTKVIVNNLCRDLLAETGSSADIPFCTFLPDSLHNDAWCSVTLHQILDYRAGLPLWPPGIGEWEQEVGDPYANYSMEQLGYDMKSITPQPGEYNYSQIGYAALTWWLERNGGKTYLLEKFLHSGVHGQPMYWTIPDSLIAEGHGFHGKRVLPWHFDAFETAMGMKSSMPAFLAYLQNSIPSLRDSLQSNQKGYEKRVRDASKQKSFALLNGWFLLQYGNEMLCYHTGHTGGHHTSVVIDPLKEWAVIIAASGKAGSGHLAFSIYDMWQKAKKKRF